MNFTQEQENRIKEMYFKNISKEIISKEMKVPEKQIKRFILKSRLQKERNLFYSRTIKNGLLERKTIQEVASEIHRTPYEVTTIAANLKIHTYFRKIESERKRQRIIEEYNKNPVGIRQMSIKLNISYSIVSETYKKNNLNNEKQKPSCFKKLTSTKTIEIIKALRETTKSMSQIAGEYTVSRQRIQQIKKMHDIQRPKN